MKRKWLAILVLGIFLTGTGLVPAVASAKVQPFSATLIITGIDETVIGTNVFPIPPGPKDPLKDGNDVVRWLVRSRNTYGILIPPGSIFGTIVMTMDGNLDKDQNGNMHGTFTIDTGPFQIIPPPDPNAPPTFQGDGQDLIFGTTELKLAAGVPTFESSDGTYNYLILPINAKQHMVMQGGTDSMVGFHAQARFEGTIVKVRLAVPVGGGEGHVVGFLPGQPLTITGKQT